MVNKFTGIITSNEEFLFPDSTLSELPEKLRLVSAKNGRLGIQLLLQTKGKHVQFHIKSDKFTPEWFQMKKVPVEYNTGDGHEQGGAMVIVPPKKPSYSIRKAPFFVYDCLVPSENGIIETENELNAVYFCLIPKTGIQAGTYTANLRAITQEGNYSCEITIKVYDVEIPKETFGNTNWFSLDAISRLHNLKYGTEEYLQMLRKYIMMMRRVRQTMFYIQLDNSCYGKLEKPYEFDFEYLYPEINLFFECGMKYLEIGPLLSRGYLENGEPDMFTSRFRCAVAPNIDIESEEGYEILSKEVSALAKFLKNHGWEDKVIFHIHDEPDVHYLDEDCLNSRKRQYFMAVCILKKYLPNVKIMEAVKTTEFKGGVDIWVPVTSSYEEQQSAFEQLRNLGEEVWTYVCCVPEGNWLNRFLDDALIHSRILMWGCEKNRLSGYLHWGFNQFPEGMDPFKATSCYNPTGLGTNFPCGDAFIVYPYGDKVCPSMRLEAERRGTEDIELLKLLRNRNLEVHDRLMGQVFIDNQHYNDNPNSFCKVYEQLLEELSNK